MAANAPVPGLPNKMRVAILAELDKEKRRLMQSQSMNSPGANIPLSSRPTLKEARDSAEQQHIAAQQKAALQHAHGHSSGYFITQDSSFGNLILPTSGPFMSVKAFSLADVSVSPCIFAVFYFGTSHDRYPEIAAYNNNLKGSSCLVSYLAGEPKGVNSTE